MTEIAASPTASPPVMDVVAPPVEKVEKMERKAEAIATATAADPFDKMVADAQKEQKTASAPAAIHDKPAKHQPAAKNSGQAQSSGVGAAITATVIIVLALAAMATYAYIQTNK